MMFGPVSPSHPSVSPLLPPSLPVSELKGFHTLLSTSRGCDTWHLRGVELDKYLVLLMHSLVPGVQSVLSASGLEALTFSIVQDWRKKNCEKKNFIHAAASRQSLLSAFLRGNKGQTEKHIKQIKAIENSKVNIKTSRESKSMKLDLSFISSHYSKAEGKNNSHLFCKASLLYGLFGSKWP